MKVLRVFVSSFFITFIFGNLIYGGKEQFSVPDIYVYTPYGDTFNLKDIKRPFIVYLGYAKCQSICQPSMFIINSALRRTGKNLKVVMIGINEDESVYEVDRFAKMFNPSFMGVKSLDRYSLVKNLNASWVSIEGDLQHTGFIYYFGRRIYKVIPFGENSDDILSEIINEDLSHP